MSHCTKYAFTYTNEEAIAKALNKLGLKPTVGLVSEFKSDFSKKVLGKLGYMGQRQFRAICAQAGKFNLMVCKTTDNSYELMIERDTYAAEDEVQMAKWAASFQRAYVSVAVDETIRRIDTAGVPTRMLELTDGFKIDFGPNYEYSIHVAIAGDRIKEEVSGVKGDLCVKLTEELEAILASPTTELATEWKPEYTVVHEEQTLQVLSANL